MADLGPCMAAWCSRPAVVAIHGPTLGPSPRVIIVGGERALQTVDSEIGALSGRCLDCAWSAVEDVAKPRTEQDAKCPHGYERGDHHWFGCMNVDPFAAEQDGDGR